DGVRFEALGGKPPQRADQAPAFGVLPQQPPERVLRGKPVAGEHREEPLLLLHFVTTVHEAREEFDRAEERRGGSPATPHPGHPPPPPSASRPRRPPARSDCAPGGGADNSSRRGEQATCQGYRPRGSFGFSPLRRTAASFRSCRNRGQAGPGRHAGRELAPT